MEYQIEGAPLPVVICQLEAGETMLTERGSMSWMTPNMKMETSTNGGLGKAFGRMLGNKVQSINNELHIVGLEQVLSHTNPCFFQCIQLIIQRLRNLVHLASRAAGALFHLYDGTTRLIKVGQNRGTNLSLPFTEQSLQKVSSILIGQLIPDIRNIGQNVIGRTISLGIVRLKQTDTPVIIACDLSKIGNRTGQFGHVCGVFLRLLIIATDTH